MTLLCVGFGIAYGFWASGFVDIKLSILALAGSVLLHAAVNIWNDYFDYRFGVDRPGVGTVLYRVHPIISGVLEPRVVLLLGFVFSGLAMCIATVLLFASRWFAIILGFVGFMLAYGYTGTPFKLKYRGLGEVSVFTAWGPLMVVGGSYVGSGFASLDTILVSIPLGLLVSAVLLANNIRDIESDKNAGVFTLAVRVGVDWSTRLYKAMVLVSYLVVAILVAGGLLPFSSLLCFASLPLAIGLVRSFSRGVSVDADPRTARVVVVFGLLYIVSIFISIFM